MSDIKKRRIISKTFSVEEDDLLVKIMTNTCDILAIVSKIERLIKGQPWKKIDSMEDLMVLIKYFVNCYIAGSYDVKLLRILSKLLNLLRKEKENVVDEELLNAVVILIKQTTKSRDIQDIRKVSNIIDIDIKIRTLLQTDVMPYFNMLVSLLASTEQDIDYTHLITKLYLQGFLLTPNFPDLICQTLSVQNHENSKDLKLILQRLIDVLFLKDISIETASLAGTCVVMVINTITNPELVTRILTSLLTALDSDSISRVEIGETSIDMPEIKPNGTVVKLVFLKAIVTSSRTEVLSNTSQLRGDNPEAFILELISFIHKLCGCNEQLYLSFQLYSLWFKKLNQLWSEIIIQEKSDFISTLVCDTIDCVWINLENPVDDVSKYCVDILQSLLVLNLDSVKQQELQNELLSRCLNIQWNVRSRYKPLQIVLPYLQQHKIDEILPGLQTDLLKCMNINHLIPHSSDVYKTCLQIIVNSTTDKEKQLNIWIETWKDLLIRGVTHSDSLTCTKINTYWIPITLKLLPSSGEYLQTYLNELLTKGNNREEILLTWCIIVKTIRITSGIDVDLLDKELLKEVLVSENEDIRIEGLALITNSNKKSEALSEIEIRLFKDFLPLNLRVDSAPFRQLLTTNIQRLLVRIRDSCVSLVKKNKESQQLVESIQFVDWLHNLFMHNLVPGVSYQRRKSCLDNLDSMYQVFSSTDKQKKGSSDSNDVLMDYARNKGLLDFYNHDNANSLMHCILDGADEIRELSYIVLNTRFIWDTKDDRRLDDIKKLSCHLLVKSITLCNKPKASDSHGGALLTRLVYNKFACIGLEFNIMTVANKLKVNCMKGSPDSSKIKFLELLLVELEISIKTAETNPVLASQSAPIHGILQAITFCVNDISSLDQKADNSLVDIIKQVVTSSVKIVNLMLLVMSGGKKSETCLSFAELGSAIETMVTDGQCENVALSPEFQCLLSWCWVNLKVCCTSLSELMSAILVSSSSDVCIIAEKIKHVFLQVLTHCRHRGAIEGCRNGLMKFALSLMSCNDAELREIPFSLMDQVFTSLECKNKMASVTRRSAGLPIIVHVLTVAAFKLKMHRMVDDVLNKFYVLASKPILDDWDERQDLPAVHGLNILKAVFGDSSLSSSLKPYYSKMVILVINSFQSPCWAVRNAASQVFSTLMLRMFGPKGGSGSVTLKELSAHYPELPVFLLSKLDENISGLCPSLFLVLAILSSLSPSPTDSQQLSEFRNRVLKITSNSIYSIRELSALSMVALIPLDKTSGWLIDLIDRLPTTSDEYFSTNLFHGYLLCTEKLLLNRDLSPESSSAILKKILQCSWIISNPPLCRLLSQKYCHIVSHLVTEYDLCIPEMDQLNSRIETAIFTKPSSLTVGDGVFKSALVNLSISISGDVTGLYCQCLLHGDVDVQSACLNRIQTTIKSHDKLINWNYIQESLWKILQNKSSLSNLKLITSILVDITLQGLTPRDKNLQSIDFNMIETQFESKPGLKYCLIPLEAILITDQYDWSKIEKWCERVKSASNGDNNEDIRISAVQGLILAGDRIFDMVTKKHQNESSASPISLIEATLQLIDEEDTDIRKMAATFISQLLYSKTNGHATNSNVCIKIFIEHIAETFGNRREIVHYLLEKLFQTGSVLRLINQSLDNQSFQALFDHDDDSFFSEKILRLVDLHYCILSCISNIQWSEFYDNLVQDLQQDLSLSVKLIQQNIKENGVMNMTSTTFIMISLTGLILCSDIVRRIASETKNLDIVSSLQSSVQSFYKLEDVHPWYQQLQNITENIQDSSQQLLN
ncbi:hypothetical protein LOTGIDRAFT_234949 [Lottia gigantea]|uniref:Uncharacterized protein n=1 Tax=Lottia gigantea TaxID=225164 RepID=V3ZTK0_LOTGI|nr:hypothetical protein LOTGIDRAFT_234949 [Lottia gigantea]ESO87707.1 hypothetical protein LOTGIDRAFT_234949 [Lottia gigantea]